MSAFWAEVTQILRGFASRPAFVVVTVLTLALGIGANTAIFSAVDALLLKNLPYSEPDRLVILWVDGTERGFVKQEVTNPGVMMEWERSLSTVEAVAAIDFWDTTLTGDGIASFVEGAGVSWRFFETLGVPLAQGRAFSPDEDIENGPKVVIVSHDFWQRELSADPEVLGTTVELDRESWTVVGVLPPGFFAPTLPRAQVFKPLQGSPELIDDFFLFVFARLKPGISIEQAEADLDTVQARLANEIGDLHDLGGYVQPLHEVLVQDVSRQLLVLQAATFFVLLIACANIANLLLARAIGRARELAIRTAVGASRWQIMRSVLVESTLLSLMGMMLGVVLAWFAVDWIITALPPDLARTVDLGIDIRALTFALVISLGTGLIAGSVPAFLTSRREASISLSEGGRGSSGGQDGQRARAVLVAGTFALALALTVSAGLFLKSLLQIMNVDPGFQAEGLLTYSLNLPEAQYPDRAALIQAQDALLARLSVVPGVSAVGFTSTLPMGGLITDTGTAIEGIPLEGDPLRTWYSRVSSGYLPALGTPLLRGRDFAPGDGPEAACVVIANETYARRYMGSDDPIGRRVLMNPQDEPFACEIVGLAKDMRFNTLAESPDPTLYLPASRFANRRFFVVMRTSGEPMTLLPTVRQAVAEIDPSLAVWAPSPMTTLVGESVRTPRQVAVLVAAFAVLALVLAASGVYGVATYNVNARMREFGVRTALGANQLDLLRLVLVGGLWLVGIGMAIVRPAGFQLGVPASGGGSLAGNAGSGAASGACAAD
jgi:putative ABC transport system permease protein